MGILSLYLSCFFHSLSFHTWMPGHIPMVFTGLGHIIMTIQHFWHQTYIVNDTAHMPWSNTASAKDVMLKLVDTGTAAIMGKLCQLSDLERGLIISYRARGSTISETVEFVQCSCAAVVKVYHEWMKWTISTTSKLQSHVHNWSQWWTLAVTVGPDQSGCYCWSTGHPNEQWNYTTSPKWQCSESCFHCKHCQFSQRYWHWTLDNWKWVAFSDESHFQHH